MEVLPNLTAIMLSERSSFIILFMDGLAGNPKYRMNWYSNRLYTIRIDYFIKQLYRFVPNELYVIVCI